MLLGNIVPEALPPRVWKQVARACLSGSDYLLWKTKFAEQYQTSVERKRAQQVPISYDTLAGEGHCRDTDQQLSFEEAAYAQVSTAAKRAWNKIPSSGGQTEDLSGIRYGPDELLKDFLSLG